MNEITKRSAFRNMPLETTKQDTRGAILDAGERLLAHYGYSKMSMNELAEEAGVGVGTIYLHFTGKAEVALAVIERSNQSVVDQLQAESQTSEPPPIRLKSMLEKRILLRYEIIRHRSHQLEEIRAILQQRKDIRPGHARWFEAETRIFTPVLLEGQKLGLFDFEEAVSAAETLLWSMDSLMPRNLKPHDFEAPERFRAKTQRLAEFVMRALRPLDRNAHYTA